VVVVVLVTSEDTADPTVDYLQEGVVRAAAPASLFEGCSQCLREPDARVGLVNGKQYGIAGELGWRRLHYERCAEEGLGRVAKRLLCS
jgi:hypothetical protein